MSGVLNTLTTSAVELVLCVPTVARAGPGVFSNPVRPPGVVSRGAGGEDLLGLVLAALPSLWQNPLFITLMVGVLLAVVWVHVRVVRLLAKGRRAQDAVRESEDKFRTLAETNPAAIFISRRGRIEYANGAAHTITGYSEVELRAMEFSDVVHVDHRHLLEDQGMEQQPGAEVRHRHEVKIVTRCGEERWVDYTAGAIDYDGARAVLGTAFDVTDRKRAEEALRQQALVFDSMYDGAILTDLEGRITGWNAGAERMFGYRLEEVLGRSPEMLDRPHEAALITRQIYERIAEQGRWSGEIHFVRRDGTEGVCEAAVVPLYDMNGEWSASVSVNRDITERKRAEEALRESEQRFRLVAQATRDAVYDWNIVADRSWRNRRYHDLFAPPDVSPDTRWRECLHADDRQRVVDSLERAFNGRGDHWSDEYRFRRADGAYCHVLDRGFILRDAAGHAVRMIGAMTDITEHHQAEEMLREREERLRAVVDASKDMMISIDRQGLITLFNPAAEKAFGYRSAELVGQPLDRLMPEEYRAAHQEYVRSYFDVGEPFGAVGKTMELLAVRRDGTVFPIALSLSVGRHAGEQFVLAVIRDITARKRAEEALRESELRYRTLFAQAPDSVVLIDVQTGALIEFNDNAHKDLGYSREQFGKLFLADIAAVETPDRLARHIQRIVSIGADTFETRQRTKSGQVRDRLVSARPVTVGGKTLIQSVWRDITERKRAAEALAASEEKYRSLFDTSRDGIDFTNLDGRIEDANQALQDMLGYTLDELRSMTYQQFTPARWAAMETGIIGDQVMTRGYSDEYEKEYIRKDGTVFPVMVRVWLVSDEQGCPLRMLGLIRDITERRQAEETVRKRRAEVAHVSRLSVVGEMAAGLAHELNQPLSAISNYASGCLRRIRSDVVEPAELLPVFEHMVEQVDRAAQVMRRIRGFVRKSTSLQRELDLNNVVREAAAFVAVEAEQRQVAVVLDLIENLPTVRADAVQIEQVLLNLVLNGIEAMDHAGPAPRQLTIHTNESTRGMVTVSVCDTGCGIDEPVLHQAFDPFFTTKPDGMGMGLSISRSIIEQHGGRIWARSNSEGGATFFFALPTDRGVSSDAE